MLLPLRVVELLALLLCRHVLSIPSVLNVFSGTKGIITQDVLLRWSHLNCGAIAQYFCDACRDFGCIITNTNYGIRTHLLGMLDNQFIGIVTRLFA